MVLGQKTTLYTVKLRSGSEQSCRAAAQELATKAADGQVPTNPHPFYINSIAPRERQKLLEYIQALKTQTPTVLSWAVRKNANRLRIGAIRQHLVKRDLGRYKYSQG